MGDAGTAVGTGEFLRVELFFAIDDGDNHQSVSELGGGFEGRFDAFLAAGLEREAIDDNLDAVVLTAVEGDFLVERVQHAVDAGANEALTRELLQVAERTCVAAKAQADTASTSSALRRRVREGRPIDYLVADAVADYIDQRRLYQ